MVNNGASPLTASHRVRVGTAFSTFNRRTRTTLSRLLLVAVLLLFGIVLVGPELWPASTSEQHALDRLQSPSAAHPLGTDQFGRDLLARIMVGGRWTLGGALSVTLGVTTLGLAVAMLASSRLRYLNIAMSRAIDALLAVPNLVIALAVASILGPSFGNLILALIIAGWPWYARAYRAAILKERTSGYVESAAVIGASPLRIAVRHIGPNIAGQVLVLATTNLGFVVLNLASLSFIGLGVQPPTPEWGAMINEARPFFQAHPYQMLVPGCCIVVTVVLVNLVGDALRDRFDPRLGER